MNWKVRTGIVVLILCGIAPSAAADLPAVAAEILAAHRAGDEERLAELAGAVENDPWRVVDDLVAAGRLEAARAYAALSGEPFAGPLSRYLKDAPKDDSKARAALQEARKRVKAGELDEALEALEGVVPPAKTILTYRVSAFRTFLYMELERYREAWAEDDVARAAAHALGRDLSAERRHVVSGYYELDRHENPLVVLRVTERMAELSHYPRWGLHSAYCYLDLATACLSCGLQDRARRHLLLTRNAFLDLLRSEKHKEGWPAARAGLAWTSLRLCILHNLAGEPSLAISRGERAIRQFREQEDPSGEANAQWVLGDAHANAGTLTAALECYRAARRLYEEAGEQYAELVFELQVNEGSTLEELGKLDEALPILTRAAKEIRNGERGAISAVTLMGLGEAQLKAGESERALATLRTALASLASDPTLEAWCRMLIGDALTLRGRTTDPERWAEAEQSYRAALDLLPEPLEPTLRMYILTGLGEARLAGGKPREALDCARRCADLLEGLTGGLADGEAVSVRGHEDRLRATSLGIDAARATEDPSLVLEMLERSRAQAFLAALGGRRGVGRGNLGARARRAIEAADQRLLAAVQIYRQALDGGRRKRVRAARERLEAARESHRRLRTSVERETRLRESAVLPEPARLDDLHRALRPDEAVVIYGLLDNRSVVLVVAGGRAWITDLPDREEIEQACAGLAVEDPNVPRAEVEKALDQLGEMLLLPLRLPGSVRHLIVSPDGALAHLPWPWLTDRHFAKRVDVALTPSATSLLAMADKRVRGTGRIALGNPDYGRSSENPARRVYLGGRVLAALPESAAETRAAAGPEGLVLTGSKATESALEEALAGIGPLQVLHLACHGVVNRSRPEYSALVLTPDEQDDGFLTALEVSALEIPAELVVLSACESGRDRFARGEGIQGLARAFLVAGADRLVVSMWKVDDVTTRLFMERFYEAWSEKGTGIEEALRRARAAVEAKHPHPAFWAAWVVWGTSR